MIRRVRATIIGRIQGVSYRAKTAIEARRLGLVGWVRNCTDGSVELEAEGDAAAVAELLAWCAHGPPPARVANVVIQELAPANAEASLAIAATER